MEQEKIAIVTGANSGMGLASTVELAKAGYRVIMACRSAQRGEQALLKARRQSGSAKIELMLCDLGSLASIREFAAAYTSGYPKLDVLLNNAGIIAIRRETTGDGFESMIGVNHLGPFLLTHLLLGHLKQAPQGRIVNVSSGAHKAGTIHFPDPHMKQGYGIWKGYAQSKLANILFTKELAERLRGTAVTVNCLHPGAVSTNIGVNRNTGFGKRLHALLRPFFLTPAKGAETANYLSLSPDVAGISGEYYYKKRVARVSAKAADKELAKRLWTWSEREVGLQH